MVKIRHLMRETCTSSLIGSLRLCLSRLGAGELVSSLMCGSAAGSAACSAAGSAAGSGMDSGAKGVGDALRDGPARLARKLARGRTKGTLLGLRDVDGGRDGGGVDVGTLGGKRRGQQLQRATGNLVGKSDGGRSRRERLWLLGGTACHCRGRRRGDAQLWWMRGVR